MGVHVYIILSKRKINAQSASLNSQLVSSREHSDRDEWSKYIVLSGRQQ